MVDNDKDANVDEMLGQFVEAAAGAFGANLVSVVLFGSGAENRLRPSSDVNLLVLLDQFVLAEAEAFREPLRTVRAAIRAKVMFLLRDELPEAAELFAVKFWDIRHRHRVLHGADPFASLAIGEDALRHRLREVLFNLALRLRESYIRLSLREEQLVPVITDAAGPLRVAAAALLALRGEAAPSPRQALERIARDSGEADIAAAVAQLPLARQEQRLPAGSAGPHLLALARLAEYLRQRLEAAA